MPLSRWIQHREGVRYRVMQTSKGPIRLAFLGKGKVVEAKKLKRSRRK